MGVIDVTRKWEDTNGIIALNNALSSLRVRRFVGTLIAFIVSATVDTATAATVTAALVDSVQTAHTVDVCRGALTQPPSLPWMKNKSTKT